MAYPAHTFFHITQAASTTGTTQSDRFASTSTVGYGFMSTEIILKGGATRGTATFDISSAPISDGWCSFIIRRESATIAANDIVFKMTGATTDLLRMKVLNNSTDWDFEYWDGSSWTQIGSTVTAPSTITSTYKKIDIRFKIADSGGEFTIYVNGSSVASLTSADTLTTADTEIENITFSAISASALNVEVCAVVVDTVDTRDLKFHEGITSSAGTLQQWTNGGESSVDNLVGDTAASSTYIDTSTDGHVDTYGFFGLNAELDGKTIEGVELLFEAQGNGALPLYVEPVCYMSGTTYDSNEPATLENGVWKVYSGAFPYDPSTGVAWASATAIEGAEFGWRAQALP